MIILAGRVFVDPDNVDAFLADARATVADGLTEEGCLFLSFTLDDPALGSVITLERWRSQTDLDAHLAKPAVQAVFATWGPTMRNEVAKWDASNERGPLD